MTAKIVVDTSVLIKWFKARDEDLLREIRPGLLQPSRRVFSRTSSSDRAGSPGAVRRNTAPIPGKARPQLRA